MDGLRLPGAQLPQPLGRPPRGGHEQDFATDPVQHGHDPPHGGGLPGAGAAGEQHNPLPGRQLHRPPLFGGVGDPLPGLDLLQNGVHPDVVRPVRLAGQHPAQLLRDAGLRLVEPPQIAGLHPGHPLAADGPPADEVVQGDLHRLRRAVDELGGGGDELVPGQKDVAVAQIVGQLEEHRGLDPPSAVPGHPHGQGNLVHDGEVHPIELVHQQIRILPHRLDRKSVV